MQLGTPRTNQQKTPGWWTRAQSSLPVQPSDTQWRSRQIRLFGYLQSEQQSPFVAQ